MDHDLSSRSDLVGLLREDAEAALRSHFASRGQPEYRVGQVLAWLYERDALSFEEMSDLGQVERRALGEAFLLEAPESAKISVSSDRTAKHLWKLRDGELIESVLIPSGPRLTLCISSQAGCAMACTFCATGWAGYRRNLTAGEVVAQYRGARRWARENGYGEITNLVYMGMGEPLMNRRAVVPSLYILNHGYGFGARRITVSTVGVVPGILELAAMPEQFRLAVSLHAPNTELRNQLIPLEKKHPLPELLDALRRFDAAGGKRITFEYVMIDGVNDSAELARQLVPLVVEFRAFVNLIPFNPIPGTDWKPSSRKRIEEFSRVLERGGVPVHVRTPRGRDIAAACGQLRAEATEGRRLVRIEG
jgi:23S rRNA (adenine2503-C2)-methyltransferase